MNQYSEFMKQYAQANNLTYKQAMQQGREEYYEWKMKPKEEPSRREFTVRF